MHQLKSYRVLLRSAFRLLCLTPLICLAQEPNPEIQAQFQKSLNSARSLTNLEIQMLDTLWLKNLTGSNDPKDSGNSFYRTFQYSYLLSGQKYRASCKLISASQTNLVRFREAAFDGTNFFTYDADERYLTRKMESAPFDTVEPPNNPLAAPFMFLASQKSDRIGCVLRFTDILLPGFADHFIFPKGKQADGDIQINLPGIPIMNQPTLWKIFLDPQSDSFAPKMIQQVAATSETVYELLAYTNLGTYKFPSIIAWRSTIYPAASPKFFESTGMIAITSMRVAEQTPDSIFKLDEKSAATVWDWDQNKFAKTSVKFDKFQAATKKTRIILLLILFTTVVGPLIILIAKRFFQKRT